MNDRRIVITGMGVVAPTGIGKEAFWDSCFAGRSGIRPISLFNTSAYRCHHAGEIADFHAEAFLGSHGLRTLDRTTRLALVAAKLAIEDAGLELTDLVCQTTGVVLGSTMGSLRSISEFDLEGLREGPRYVNPALFPNAVINSPASQVSIRFKLQGLNATIATGFTAGLDAIGYALDMLRLGRARVVIAGGVEELCLQTFLGFYQLGFLATAANGAPPYSAPLHQQRGGTLLGEGAAFVVLESFEDAIQRGAGIYADVLSYSTAFHQASLYRYDASAASSVRALRQALREADVAIEDVDCLSGCANATKACDAMEMTAIRTVFGSRSAAVPLTAVKAMLGESFSAAGTLQLAATLGALARQQLPPTVQWDGKPLRTALVHTLGLAGIASAVVVRRVP